MRIPLARSLYSFNIHPILDISHVFEKFLSISSVVEFRVDFDLLKARITTSMRIVSSMTEFTSDASESSFMSNFGARLRGVHERSGWKDDLKVLFSSQKFSAP